ncbi:hypothetical protein Lalb_Chr09g0321341 [Lupinus albus]|uniref:DUF241 domain protein n=1 Tax=Lupinus albus TaxID=3870 RepID=A0A6A4PYE5_LUPAL|nr:hypothetical protein Lalb_Chr09g0321341 [Lupinus albus]
MEAISKFPYTHQPLRSISLPTRVHPSSQRVEALLNHLKPHHSQSLSSNICFDAETIQSDLLVLAELYSCMEELFHSPQIQQALLHYHDGKLIEDTLNGSVTLLDACGSARDLLMVLKEHVQSLQSAIRRRKGDSSIDSSISAYDSFRKKAKKEISKQFGMLKRMENKVNFSISLINQDQELIFLAKVLREASSMTISILCSLLLFMSMPALRITKGSSLLSKLKPNILFSSQKEQKNTTNGVADINVALRKGEVQEALRLLETLNVSIDDLEGGIDCIFRCLVKNRVSFLNMLAH